MINHIEHCLKKKISKLTDKELAIPGMTTPRIRHFLNNLLEFPGARYLEVGVWKGATFVSAMYGNDLDYVCGVDNFSDGGRGDFLYNTSGYDFSFFKCDAVVARPEKGVNIYFYDAGKTLRDMFLALSSYQGCLADEFIYIVDDYNYPMAQVGTEMAIKRHGLEKVYFNHLGKREYNEQHPGEWWQGLLVSVLRK